MFESYIKPAIDILLVSFIIYRVYSLLSRTRAVQLLIGFGLILVADYLSKKYEFTTISWLITNVSQYLVIGLIVLLQPELRRLVAEMGRMPIFQRFSPPPEVPLREIVDAAIHMGSEKVGSLIVILRDLRPQGIIDQAVSVDSRVTAELLETIFFKDSPLHDGAVIIEGSRIVAASCYLPLSHARDIKKTYGARHRAALGLSEESDAVILVTSEETGQISIIKHGEMTTNISPDDLHLLLSEVLNEKSATLFEKLEFIRSFRAKKGEDTAP